MEKRKKQLDLRDLFGKKTQTNEQTDGDESCGNDASDTAPSLSANPVSLPVEDKDVHENDIGLGVAANLKHEVKLLLLTETWAPPMDYEFPLLIFGNQNRKFNRAWLSTYPWLCYSKLKEGAFCRCCVLFGSTTGGKSSQELRHFVKEPWRKYRKAKEDLDSHSRNEYHQFAQSKAEEFRKIYVNSSAAPVNVAMNEQTLKIIESNRRRLRPIIDTVLLCAKSGLSFRGHRDATGPLNSDQIIQSCLNGNHGVFLAILASKLQSGDPDLKYHMETTKKNSTFISGKIQNEILNCIGTVVRTEITKEIQRSKFFSLLCDETTDVSGDPQLVFCVRYVDLKHMQIREDFLGFEKISSKTGHELRKTVGQYLNRMGLDLANMRGQGYDGGSNMAGRLNGLQALVTQEFPLAFYMHCFSHCLNLVLSSSCELFQIRNMIGILGKVSSFFSISSKRTDALRDEIPPDANVPQSGLKPYCPTRWVERHDSVKEFREKFQFTLKALGKMKRWRDADTSSTASSYEAALMHPDFIVSMEILYFVMNLTATLSQQLQQPSLDLSQALEDVDVVVKTLTNAKEQSVSTFSEIYAKASQMAREAGTEISLNGRGSRKGKKGYNRPEDFYRQTVFVPFLDHVIENLKVRLGGRLKTVVDLQGLIPSKLDGYSGENIMNSAKVYRKDWAKTSEDQLRSEVALWRTKWDSEKVVTPSCAMTALQQCGSLTPTIALLLQIFATLPITTASAERSFSVLRRLKTYLRSTMGEERLNDLAICAIHNEVVVKKDDIIDCFAKMHPRRLQFGDWSKEDNE